jgi:hypothetical protein
MQLFETLHWCFDILATVLASFSKIGQFFPIFWSLCPLSKTLMHQQYLNNMYGKPIVQTLLSSSDPINRELKIGVADIDTYYPVKI